MCVSQRNSWISSSSSIEDENIYFCYNFFRILGPWYCFFFLFFVYFFFMRNSIANGGRCRNSLYNGFSMGVECGEYTLKHFLFVTNLDILSRTNPSYFLWKCTLKLVHSSISILFKCISHRVILICWSSGNHLLWCNCTKQTKKKA